MKPVIFQTEPLRSERSARFWKELIPYFRYVAASGSLAFSLAVMLGIYGYTEFLKTMPSDFPVRPVAAAVLLICFAISPVRTYLKQADIVFLLPVESGMTAYFRKSVVASSIVQCLIVLFIWALLWPMYKLGTGVSSAFFWIVGIQCLILKCLNVYAGWRINQLRERAWRRTYASIRVVLTAGLAYAVVSLHPAWALLLTGIGFIVLLLWVQRFTSFPYHWEHLIRLEQKHRAKYFSFIGAFTDVPREHAEVYNNRLARYITANIPFKQNRAFFLLYAATWARSELFGIAVRLTIVGIVVISITEGDLLKIGLYVLFAFICGVQLSALNQYHRYSEWVHIYPLDPRLRVQSANQVVAITHLLVNILLALPLLVTAANPLAGVLAAALVVAVSLAVPRFRRK
ncbi:ABC transporter permease [Paenibacillus thalictri]|uniref:ABC transporter permease n=1 Tax=Paenibacillus thalictri TaxID=2527873 RepID=A0A4Q9DWY9_9BACL|nr:ABC transporter permease [Paenibacillus thalictri]TBL80352.1 ABC transporter permease [Paenibacillus thalictri]